MTDNQLLTLADKVQFTNTALIFSDNLQRNEWDAVWSFVQNANSGIQWWVGDCLNFGERKYGETYTQALEETNYEYDSLRACKWVSEEFETVRRRTNLSWSHHREVVSLPRQQQEYWLDYASNNGLSRNELRSAIKGGIPELKPSEAGDFSWFKDEEYKSVQDEIKPNYRHFISRVISTEETSEATKYVAQMERLWMLERCEEIEKRWGVD